MVNEIYFKEFNTTIKKTDLVKLVQYQQEDIIYIAGSLVEGIGNKYSDIDIFILVNDFEQLSSKDITYATEASKTQFSKLYSNINCDIEYWPMSLLEDLIQQLDNMNLNDLGARALNQLKARNCNFGEIKTFLHRFINSEGIYNDAKLEMLKNRLDKNKFYRLAMRTIINGGDNIYDDVVGNLEIGNYETALLGARDMLAHSISAYIYSKGMSIDRMKWIYEKLRILSKNDNEALEVLNRFVKLSFYSPIGNHEELAEHVENMLSFSNKVIKLASKNFGGV